MRRRSVLAQTAPFWAQPLRWLAILSCAAYYRIPYRIRSWGRLPAKRGPALLIANHQHEVESPIVVADATLRARCWRFPIFTVSSRRMWEPGFLAERLPWLRGVLRNANLGALFAAIGMQPIENDLRARPFASIAYALADNDEPIACNDLFDERARARLGPGIDTSADLLRLEHFAIGRAYVSFSDVREPYRERLLTEVRTEIEADLAHIEALVRAGATFFLTPEGYYSGDGRMQRLRGALARLAPLARAWIVGISYDPFVGRRLSMLYRIVDARDGATFDMQLKAARPVTTSALLATYLQSRTESFTFAQAIDNVRAQLAGLPAALFVDPELAGDPAGRVRAAIAGMLRLGTAERRDARRFALTGIHRHPGFPRTDDTIAYQAAFHAETLAGARANLG